MRSPFLELRREPLDNPRGEEVSGAFSCQERGCNSTVSAARYLQEVEILTWECANGHINKIEGFHIG